MKKYKSKRNLFDPLAKEPFRLSRTKIELFMNCPRCFYLDRRHGIAQPGGLPFSLNAAVDALLKKEFDIHRSKKTAHPLMKHYGIEAVPFDHEKINIWRNNFKGVDFFHQPTNFIIFGAIDDLWQTPKGEIMVVDYKATSKEEAVNLDADWQIGYKRQMEIYQWLFRKNGFPVASTGYFVYANGKKDRLAFDGRLEFDITVIPYKGDDSWIEAVLVKAHDCLMRDELPKADVSCEFCNYRQNARKLE